MSHQLKPGPWLKVHEELGVQPPDFDDRPLGTFVEEYAESIADNSSIRYYDQDVSYRELNELSSSEIVNLHVELTAQAKESDPDQIRILRTNVCEKPFNRQSGARQ